MAFFVIGMPKGGESVKIEKAREIRNVRIEFVSLVDRAANNKQFLITKSAEHTADFLLSGRILKADRETHHITGIVYEPMTEDAHGDFMTEEEIQKAAYWFAKNSAGIDRQHNFKTIPGAVVVENWVTKSDTEIAGETVRKGTWLVTVETDNADVWEAIQKGEVTGFSMGGVGEYVKGEITLNTDETTKAGVLKRLAGWLGFDSAGQIEKGKFAENYGKSQKGEKFWRAFRALEDALYSRDWEADTEWFETDESKIRESLSEFSVTLTGILAETDIMKALSESGSVEKAGKKISGKNYAALTQVCSKLTELVGELGNGTEKEENSMTQEEIQALADAKVAKALGKPGEYAGAAEVETMVDAAIEKLFKAFKTKDGEEDEADKTNPAVSNDGTGGTKDTKPAPKNKPLTAESAKEMVDAAVKQALVAAGDKITAEVVQLMVKEAVTKAVEPILKARGLAYNANGEPVEKSGERHYLTGIL
jgi:hypothetical protein